jgi:hypothetical protein
MKYFLMLKRGLPPAAAVAKMNLEGVSGDEQSTLLNYSAKMGVMQAEDVSKYLPSAALMMMTRSFHAGGGGPAVRLVGLHWEQVDHADLDKTVWGIINKPKPCEDIISLSSGVSVDAFVDEVLSCRNTPAAAASCAHDSNALQEVETERLFQLFTRKEVAVKVSEDKDPVVINSSKKHVRLSVVDFSRFEDLSVCPSSSSLS